MSDGETEDVAQPGPSFATDDSAAAALTENGNPLLQLQAQITELSKRHDDVRSSIASLGDVQPRSIVYIPREKQIVPFTGDPSKDTYLVDEFIEEIERAVRARGLREDDQVDFMLSLLKGSALEEVKLRMHGRVTKLSDLFSYLREAFREKRSTPQLLHSFYARRQLDGEDLRDYSHALSQLLNSVLLQSPSVVADPQQAIRDQFIEGVRDPTLRRELRRLVREKPQCNLFEVREEAIMWSLEDRPRSFTVARSRNLVSNSPDHNLLNADSPSNMPTDLATILQEVVKIVAQQVKAIGELTSAVRELNNQQVQTNWTKPVTKPRVTPRYTEDGQPICLRCQGVGHMARQCNARRPYGQSSTAPVTAVPGNEGPRLP